MNILVIPSNREEHLVKFLDAWQGRGGWDKVILIEDNPERTFKVKVDHHYAWADIDQLLGRDAWIFSHRDSAIRCFGFVAAYHLGADYVLTLDDDCYPCPSLAKIDLNILRDNPSLTHTGFHVDEVMLARSVWSSSCFRGGLFQRTRGIPYSGRGVLSNVVANMGLWENIGDWDSKQIPPAGYFRPDTTSSRIIPHGQLIPVCGMNLCVSCRALPLFYFPLMGEGQPYRRFDDIWAGIIAKHLMDHLKWYLSVGEPFVNHIRASDPEVNKVKEAPGIEANEWMWKEITSCRPYGRDVLSAVESMGNHLRRSKIEYVAKMGLALNVWWRLFTYPYEARFTS